MLKVLIIAEKETSLPFRGIGVEAIIPSSQAEEAKILKDSFRGDYGVLFVAESIAGRCLNLIGELSEKNPLPIITIIPDYPRTTVSRVAQDILKRMIKKAVGMELPE